MLKTLIDLLSSGVSSKKPTVSSFDKVFSFIGKLILWPFVRVHLWFDPYLIEEEKKFHGNFKCYCGSGSRHHLCCGPKNGRKGLTAYRVAKVHWKTKERIESIELIKTHSTNRIKFKPGMINPLNRNGRYRGSGIDAYAGGDAISDGGADCD